MMRYRPSSLGVKMMRELWLPAFRSMSSFSARTLFWAFSRRRYGSRTSKGELRGHVDDVGVAGAHFHFVDFLGNLRSEGAFEVRFGKRGVGLLQERVHVRP